jgi:hypothetical protein
MILPYGVLVLLKKQDVKVLGMLDGVKSYVFTLIPGTERISGKEESTL